MMLEHLKHWDRQLATHYGHFAGSRVVALLGRVVVGTLWTFVAMVNAQYTWQILSTPDPVGDLWSAVAHSLLQTAFIWLIAIFVVVRRPARQFMPTVSSGVAALAGTWILVLLGFNHGEGTYPLLVPFSNILLLLGIVVSIWSIATLGRCFSILPEVRGLVVRGPYRWVRHPLYLGEILGAAGILLPIIGFYNLVLFGTFVALQLSRTYYEEANLTRAFPEYEGYRARTWRLLPGIV